MKIRLSPRSWNQKCWIQHHCTVRSTMILFNCEVSRCLRYSNDLEMSTGISQLMNWSLVIIWSGIGIENVENSRRRRPRKKLGLLSYSTFETVQIRVQTLVFLFRKCFRLLLQIGLIPEKSPFFLLFHFISKTPPHPPSHLRTGNLGIPCFGSKFSSAALRAAKTSIYERFRQIYGLIFQTSNASRAVQRV